MESLDLAWLIQQAIVSVGGSPVYSGDEEAMATELTKTLRDAGYVIVPLMVPIEEQNDKS